MCTTSPLHPPVHEAARGSEDPAGSGTGPSLVPAVRRMRPGASAEYAFRIVGPRGRIVRALDTVHERPLHLLVVRHDLTDFHHLHPGLGPDGMWRTWLPPLAPGVHRVVADLSVEGVPATPFADLLVPGEPAVRPLPRPAPTAVADGFEVTVDRDGELLRFSVADASGRPATLAPHLGAAGHLVAVRAGDLALVHVHPLDDPAPGAVTFHIGVPDAGTYRLFLQLRPEGRLITTAFTVDLSATAA